MPVRVRPRVPHIIMTEQEKEILVIAQEECAEVIQEISKIFRFGIDQLHKDGMTHRVKLETELGDLLCMIDLIVEHGLASQAAINDAKLIKIQKLKKWSNILT